MAFTLMSLRTSNAEAQVPSDGWGHCKIAEVAVFSNRVHVMCASAAKGSGETTIFANQLFYFALPLTDNITLRAFLDMAHAAILSGKTFHAHFPATATAPCGPGDACRVPDSFLYR